MQRLSPAGRSAAARRHRDAALVRPNAVGPDAEHGAPLVTVPAEDSPIAAMLPERTHRPAKPSSEVPPPLRLLAGTGTVPEHAERLRLSRFEGLRVQRTRSPALSSIRSVSNSPRSRVGDHTHEMPLEQAERAIQMLGGEVPGEEAICISLHP